MTTDTAPQREERHSQRERYLNRVLEPVGVTLTELAPGTVEALHGYARFILTHADAPSASWNTPVMELCRAAECEVAARLGSLAGLARLADDIPLGQKARFLSRLSAHKAEELGLDPNVLESLARLLKGLARVRGKSGAAHGSAKPRHATKRDGQQAETIVIEARDSVIPILVQLKKPSSPPRRQA